MGAYCDQRLSRRTVLDVRAVLRSALSNAMAEELITKNVAGIKIPRQRTRKIQPRTVEEARRFLVNAREDADPFYPPTSSSSSLASGEEGFWG